MKHSMLNLIINVNNSFDFFPRTKFNIVAEFKLFLAFQIYKKTLRNLFRVILLSNITKCNKPNVRVAESA